MVGLLIGAVSSKILRLIDDQPVLGISQSITQTNVVRLDASPAASAVVVSEQDGKVLGKTPLTIQAPAKRAVAVLVAAAGHEPTRVMLPRRGRINVTLEPYPSEGPQNCTINLHVPTGIELESVGAKAESDSAGFRVPGSTVLRSIKGQGAWLLACPELGGERIQTLPGRAMPDQVELRVSKPVDMEVWVDGELQGTTPIRKRIPPGFKHIKISNGAQAFLERWVPILADTNLELPPP